MLSDLRRLELERQIKAEEFRRPRRDIDAVSSELAALDQQIAAHRKRRSSARNQTCAPGS